MNGQPAFSAGFLLHSGQCFLMYETFKASASGPKHEPRTQRSGNRVPLVGRKWKGLSGIDQRDEKGIPALGQPFKRLTTAECYFKISLSFAIRAGSSLKIS